MKISRIEITNILGTEHASFEPGTITVISGANGTGKTSILDAVAAVFAGGHDSGLIRNGATKGRILLHLDNGVTISRSVTPSASTVEIKDADGIVVPSPMSFIQKLGEAMAVNPARLLKLDTTKAPDRKALAAELLRVMPIEFSPEDFAAAAPRYDERLRERQGEVRDDWAPIVALVQSQARVKTLADLNKFRKGIEETRRQIGVAVRDADGTIKQLSSSLANEEDFAADLERAEELRGRIELLAAKTRDEQSQARKRAERERTEIQNRFAEEERNLRDQFQRLLRELDAKRIQELDQCKDQETSALTLIAETNDSACFESELKVLAEREAAYERAQGARQTIENMRVMYSQKQSEYDRWTKALELIDATKQTKLDNLPVPGLEVTGDQVMVDGVLWEHVNTARRVEIALQLAGLRAGELPFLILDDAEHLDQQTFAALRDAAKDAGFQVLTAIVSDEPLRISIAN